ncbi:hypothetical protein [Nocardioides ungokensis]|uniref:hypothetical protein n=1 Tax=Nocardioides ungokensis TaxID=1643322 RepID=UPI0015DEEA02|nr:hypothetical protein [Nocardioides ungokensis]
MQKPTTQLTRLDARYILATAKDDNGWPEWWVVDTHAEDTYGCACADCARHDHLAPLDRLTQEQRDALGLL